MDGEMATTGRPTVADLTGDSHFATLARSTWLTTTLPKLAPEVVEKGIWIPLLDDGIPHFSLLLLEQLQALERYLWPGYTENASNNHILLLILLANAKRQERLPVWPPFADRPDEFSDFFKRVLYLSIDNSLSTSLQTHVLSFLVHAFQSLDNALLRKECAPLFSIGIWQHIHSDTARETLLGKNVQLQKAWRAAGKRFDNADSAGQGRLKFERSWLYTLLLAFLDKLYHVDPDAGTKRDNLRYCERLVELLCDLQSQLPTRRYINALLQDLNLLSGIRLSPLYDGGSDAALLRDMYELLQHYTEFPVDDQTGRELSQQECNEALNGRIARLQQVALRLQEERLKILTLSSYGTLTQRDELMAHLKPLSDSELVQMCEALSLRTQYPERSLVVLDRSFFLEILVSYVERKPLYKHVVEHDRPILPTERTLYDPSQHRNEEYSGSHPLAIPKLNLQYLTIGDFLWRSFTLFRSESFFEIRKHLEDTVKRLQPRSGPNGSTRFDGFSRMAIPIAKPAIIETLPPRVGEDVASEVKIEVILDVSRLQPGLRREWEGLRDGDVVFLIAVQPSDTTTNRLTNGDRHITEADSAAEKAGIKFIRCAEVLSVFDENSRIIKRGQNDRDNSEGFARPKQRRLLLSLDATTYKTDKERADAGEGDIYQSINLIIRRKARENNFYPILESIRQLIISGAPVPAWLQDVFLGFGDPSSASYKRLPDRLNTVEYRDTFLDWSHLIEALPGKIVEPGANAEAGFPPPYVLQSSGSEAAAAPVSKQGKKRRRDQPDGPEPAPTAGEIVHVSTYKPPNTGPYPTDAPKLNSIRFTAAQVEAITSGTQPGLTLIVGPPGTGKTDVATQIISNIYHDFPGQRTLLVAHSNQALNQLFQKIAALDIDERHLLRLGHGEEELTTEANYSKAGRVESFMERGSVYLAEVQRLADSIGAPGAHGSSCETASYFEEVYVRPLWKTYWDGVLSGSAEDVAAKFPFYAFFADAPQPLFPQRRSKEDLTEIAKGCERHIQRIFDELADIRPFEILRAQRDKSNYLLIKEARIIAMTSTHAAMRRDEIAGLGFHYDNVIMEEAAQITEIEAFIPFVLQSSKSSTEGQPLPSPLKRIILVGDHLQNSPVVQNAAFRTYANMEQSLFQRLIRLGVPHVMLDAQGRSRPSIAELYHWRYPRLTDLPFTSTAPEFTHANAGLRHEYQFIDVPDYKGQGESEPSPHFIQNLGEAEYVVAFFQYMRLLGYPAEKISILATYSGQKALIRDVLAHRCKGNRLFGMPGWLGTVDKYQGEQNDYVILSLVRTKGVGFLRDLRRLTVALSRARLGLYVFGRKEVFESSLELREAFRLLFQRQNKLSLVTGEMHPTSRGVKDEAASVPMEGVEHLGQYVYEMTQAKIQALKEGEEVLPPSAETHGRVEDEEADDGDEDVDVANGDEEDEEDEAGAA